jgi:hypothetical protein
MRGLIVLILTSILSSTCYAVAVVNDFKVDFVRVDQSGRGYIQFDTPLVNPSSCINSSNPGYLKSLAFDATTDGGKAILSVALSAKMSGKAIVARGTGTCMNYPNVIENWSFGYVR